MTISIRVYIQYASFHEDRLQREGSKSLRQVGRDRWDKQGAAVNSDQGLRRSRGRGRGKQEVIRRCLWCYRPQRKLLTGRRSILKSVNKKMAFAGYHSFKWFHHCFDATFYLLWIPLHNGHHFRKLFAESCL